MDDTIPRFEQALSRLVLSSERSVLIGLAARISSLTEIPDLHEIDVVASNVSPSGIRFFIREFLLAWIEDSRALPPQQIASFLRCSSDLHDCWRAVQPSAELVWSGPEISGRIAPRKTEQVLLSLIERAISDIWIWSFAIQNMDALTAAISATSKRGVRVKLVAENESASSGRLSCSRGLEDFTTRVPSITIFEWAKDKRHEFHNGMAGTMHAKGAVADGTSALVTSANLTDAAMVMNIEMGVLIHGGDIPRQIRGLWESLEAERYLRVISP